MLRAKKIELVSDLNNIFNSYSSVFIIQYKGMNVNQMEDLRSKIYETDSGFKVIKNKLAAIAIQDTPGKDTKDFFTGPTAIIWSNDPVAVPKILVEFAKKVEHLKIVGGVYNGKRLESKDINTLSSIPSLDELKAKLIAIIQTPATNIVGLTQKPASLVVGVLKAFSEK